ncbi:MAG: GAF domain-containing protein [Ignavibacteria bacterium]|nr:GAF domain-containing protein [Ignavibacteria bacterium]
MKKNTATSRRRLSARPQQPRKKFPRHSLIDKVRGNILFSNVDSRTLSTIVPQLTEHRYKQGQVIFDESTKGRDLYLILEGKVRIKKYTKYGFESLLAVLHTGDFFGELSIIDGLPRSARAEAMEKCSIVSFSASDLRSLIIESDAFTFNLLKNLAFRLRTLDQTFVVELERNALISKNKLDKLNQLIEASKTVNSTIELDKLLVLILDAAAHSINADRGTLYLVDESTGQLWSKISQGKNMVEIRLPLGKGLAGHVAATGETINIADAYKDPRFHPEIDKKSGYKTHNVLCMPMRDRNGKIVGVFQLLNKKPGPFTPEDESFIDALSVHAAIAIENARIAQEMVRSERLSAVGRMASSIIHDIKNPMGTLRMYAQIIQDRSGSGELADMAKEIINQVDRFVSMTQEILDFSRGVSEMKIESVQLSDVINEALDSIEASLTKKNVKLIRKYEYREECYVDIEKIIRVIYNLASNAADAMPQGGSLTVLTRKSNNHVLIEVADTGTGMTEEIRSKVFEPFFTSGKKHGTGLGLSIVKKIIDDHKGSIEIEPTFRRGTKIKVLLPLN